MTHRGAQHAEEVVGHGSEPLAFKCYCLMFGLGVSSSFLVGLLVQIQVIVAKTNTSRAIWVYHNDAMMGGDMLTQSWATCNKKFVGLYFNRGTSLAP